MHVNVVLKQIYLLCRSKATESTPVNIIMPLQSDDRLLAIIVHVNLKIIFPEEPLAARATGVGQILFSRNSIGVFMVCTNITLSLTTYLAYNRSHFSIFVFLCLISVNFLNLIENVSKLFCVIFAITLTRALSYLQYISFILNSLKVTKIGLAEAYLFRS